MKVKRSGNGVYTLSYHVVLVTKYRRKILNPDMVEYLQRRHQQVGCHELC